MNAILADWYRVGMHRLLFGIILAVAVPAFAAGDQTACMNACSQRTGDCLQGCKDERCMSRCTSKVENCTRSCGAKPIEKSMIQNAKKEQAAPKGGMPKR